MAWKRKNKAKNVETFITVVVGTEGVIIYSTPSTSTQQEVNRSEQKCVPATKIIANQMISRLATQQPGHHNGWNGILLLTAHRARPHNLDFSPEAGVQDALRIEKNTDPNSTTEFIKFSLWTFGILGPLLRCLNLPLLIFCWERAHCRHRVGGPSWAQCARRLEPFLRICSGYKVEWERAKRISLPLMMLLFA